MGKYLEYSCHYRESICCLPNLFCIPQSAHCLMVVIFRATSFHAQLVLREDSKKSYTTANLFCYITSVSQTSPKIAVIAGQTNKWLPVVGLLNAGLYKIFNFLRPQCLSKYFQHIVRKNPWEKKWPLISLNDFHDQSTWTSLFHMYSTETVCCTCMLNWVHLSLILHFLIFFLSVF